jgi:hypothetical protein
MKYVSLLFLLCLIACTRKAKEKILAGVYVGHFEHEYGINDDTLIITKANEGHYMFKLIRKTGTVRKEHGKELTRKSTVRNYLLEFDEKKQMFTDLKEGKIFLWNDGNKSIQLGSTVYRRL